MTVDGLCPLHASMLHSRKPQPPALALTPAGSLAFAEALLNPRPAGERLRAGAERYKAVIQRGEWKSDD